MKNLKIIVLMVAIFLTIFTGCSHNNEQKNKKPIVAVSSFALYDITQHLAQKSVELIPIIPFGVDPHSFEPTPKLMAKLEQADLILYSGAGLEPWIAHFHFKQHAIDMSKYVRLRSLKKGEDHHHSKQHKEAHHTVDPHYWLDFSNMEKMVDVVLDALIALEPENKAMYEANAHQYKMMLQKLEKQYTQSLRGCTVDTVVVSHNALGYLAQKYNFHVESLTGLSPEAQPSAKDITRIMNDIKQDGINTIFFEHFVNDNVIKSIAQDSGVMLDVFQPLGNITAKEAQVGLTYEDIMHSNLKKLSKALACH